MAEWNPRKETTMKRLTDTAIRAVLASKRSGRIDLVDGAVSGLTLRIGRTRGATWSLLFRVVGEGGVTDRGHARKGVKRRISLGNYPEVSLEWRVPRQTAAWIKQGAASALLTSSREAPARAD